MNVRRLTALLCAALLLPLGAFAENTVEILPTAAPMLKLEQEEKASSYYGFEDLSARYMDEWEYQTPALTRGEIIGLWEAEERWENGKRPEKSILDLTEDVHVALIRLPEDQYEGESWFLLLPNRALTDEELLQLVDAYRQIGVEIKEGMITWHNCMRGGQESMRSLKEEERERYSSIGGMFTRSGLRPDTPFTVEVTDDGIGCVGLDEEDYSGMDRYFLYPARRLTDDELLQLYAFNNAEPAAAPNQMAEYEEKLRLEMYSLMGMPLSAERDNEEYVQPAGSWDVYGDERMAYFASFREVGGEGRTWQGVLDITTGKLIRAFAELDDRYLTMQSDIRLNPWGGEWKWDAYGTVMELRMRKDGNMNINDDKTRVWCEQRINNLYGALSRVVMEDGAIYRVWSPYVLKEAACVYYNDAFSMACEDEYSIHSMAGIRGNE